MFGKRTTTIFLALLTGVALSVCCFIAKPFFKPIAFAAAIGFIFAPVHKRVRRVIRGPNSAALLSTILVILLVIVPAILLGTALTHELTDTYHFLARGNAGADTSTPYPLQQIQKLEQWIAHAFGLSELDLRDALQRRLEEGTAYLPALAGKLLGNITAFILDVFTTVFTLFFFFRDGEYIKLRAAAAIPLNLQQLTRLGTSITSTLNASIYGIIVIGLGQGFLTGLAFWILSLPSPILWGVVTAMFSLVPVVGTGFVWIPASIILMTTGHWLKGLILLAWGAGIVHPVDNIVRPYLISGRVKLHTLAVFFTLLGGLKAFGLLGLLLGPIILSVTLALLGMMEDEGRNWASVWDSKKAVQTSQNGDAVPVKDLVSGSRSL